MEQIIEQLNDYMSRTGASQTKVAKALGISHPQLLPQGQLQWRHQLNQHEGKGLS